MTTEMYLYPLFSLKSTVSRFQSLASGGRNSSQGKALALTRIVRTKSDYCWNEEVV